MTRPLSDDASRRAVCERLDTTMLVEAGAGSGKTTLIVDRLLALVKSGISIDGIAAVTFTRKAANELRERFETRLEHEAPADARCRNALRERERMFIGTIHAFCGRILRENAIEAGLPPSFEELDDVAESILRERFWQTFSTNAQLDGHPVAIQLEEAGIMLSDLLESFGAFHAHRDATFNAVAAPMPDHREVASVLLQLDGICEELRTRAGGKRCPVFDVLASAARSARSSDNWARGADFARAARRLPRTIRTGFAPTTLLGRKEADKQPMKKLAAAYEQFIDEYLIPWEKAWAAFAYEPTIRMLTEASIRFAEERRHNGQLTFDDLLWELARLLRERPRLRSTISARWTHLLIDEFQDTDPTQAEIALLLASSPDTDGGEWMRAVPRPGSLFLVGDPRQSIYRFRRADIAVYEFVKEVVVAHGEVHTLTSNFRSTGRIAALVNEHFSTAFPGEVVRNGSEVVQAAFVPMNAVGPNAQAEGRIARYVVGDGSNQIDFSVRNADARLLASWIASRIQAGERKASDFLVITSQRGGLPQYAREFSRFSIPVEVDGARHDTDDLLQELIIVLRAIADPAHPVRVIAALEGISCGASHADLFAYRGPWDATQPVREDASVVSQGLAQLHQWWRLSQRLPAASLIERVVDDLALMPLIAGRELGENRAGLLLHLVSRIREQQGDASSVDGALHMIDEVLRAENTAPPLRPHRAGALRLMNLHRAKGLEANVVILAAPVADAERIPSVIAWRAEDGSTQGALRFERQSCLMAAPLDWDLLAAADRERRDEELHRLRYVAVTRAREELIVAQRRPWSSKSSGPQIDESAWAPLAGILAEEELLEPVNVLPAQRGDVDDIDVNSLVEKANSARAAAAIPGYLTSSVTDAAKQSAIGSDSEYDDLLLSERRRPIVDNGAQAGMEMGSAMHEVLNGALRGRNGDDLNRFLRAVAWKYWGAKPAPTHAEYTYRLQRLVANAMNSDAWQQLANGTTMSEVPLAALDNSTETPVLVEGVLDAVTFGEDEAIIVDWKSAMNTERFDNLLSSYRQQTAMYAAAVRQRTGTRTSVIIQPVEEA